MGPIYDKKEQIDSSESQIIFLGDLVIHVMLYRLLSNGTIDNTDGGNDGILCHHNKKSNCIDSTSESHNPLTCHQNGRLWLFKNRASRHVSYMKPRNFSSDDLIQIMN